MTVQMRPGCHMSRSIAPPAEWAGLARVGVSKTFSVTRAVICPGKSDRIPVIRAAGMTAPA